MALILEVKGPKGTLRVHDKMIEIVFSWSDKGTKMIPYKSITAVQMKAPGWVTNGYLQLVILGSVESKAGILAAVHDENSFFFTKQEAARMEFAREFIQSQVINDGKFCESAEYKDFAARLETISNKAKAA